MTGMSLDKGFLKMYKIVFKTLNAIFLTAKAWFLF